MKYSFFRGFLLLAFTVSLVSLHAEEAKKSDFPGKPGIEFKQTFHSGSKGNLISAVEQTFLDDCQAYSSTEFKALLAFKLLDGFYTVTPWAKERLDLYMVDYDSLAGSIRSRVRNRVEFGVNNSFNLAEGLKLSANLGGRVENNLNRTAKDKYGNIRFPAVKFVLMPSLALGYGSDFGLLFHLALISFYIFTRQWMRQKIIMAKVMMASQSLLLLKQNC